MKAETAIACYLTDAELQKRRTEYLDKMSGFLIDVIELESGFRYRFRIEENTLQDLATIIDLERKCCPFLSFDLKIESGVDAVSLDLTGPKGTKDAVRSLLNWN